MTCRQKLFSGRPGFTIVEMLVSLAVIAILLGIVTTVASSAIRSARDKKASAMASALQVGIATFYAQRGEWPTDMQAAINNTDQPKIKIVGSEADAVFRQIVKESVSGNGSNPLVDVSGLFVTSASSLTSNKKAYGIGFNEAIKGDTRRSPLTLSQMAFGYADPSTAAFKRFSINYNVETDYVTVSR